MSLSKKRAEKNVMVDSFVEYISLCLRDVPGGVFVGAIVFFIGAIVFSAMSGPGNRLKWCTRLLLFEYLVLLIVLAVLTRKVEMERMYNFTPFWTYRAIKEGDYLSKQAIMNVLAFIPVGFLLGCVSGRMKWWKALLIGGGFSILIEILQFVFRRGFAEFDDVFHNTLGCAIGIGVFVGVTWLVKRFRL